MQDKVLQSISTALPKRFSLEIAALFENAYQEAHSSCYENPTWEIAEAEYLYPHTRRCILEAKMRQLAKNHGLATSIRVNAARNYRYTEIIAGDWLFTLKHTTDERYMLKESEFRKQNAKLNEMLPQLEILGIVDQFKDSASLSASFNAIIFHSKDRDDISIPGYIKIGVPKVDYSWWEARYDIHELISSYSADQTEEEAQLITTWKARAERNAI
jgi:hypothetical protein